MLTQQHQQCYRPFFVFAAFTYKLALSCVFTALSSTLLVASSSILVPHLTGVFVALDNVTASRSVDGWVQDLQAMKKIGIEWFCIRAVLVGTGPGTTTPDPACPFGQFDAYYPLHNASSLDACAKEIIPGGDPIGVVLQAAEQVGLKVHLGLGFLESSQIPPWMNTTTYYKGYASISWTVAQEIWELYGMKYKTVIQGWYTGIEESNSLGELQLMRDLAGHYLEPIAWDIKNLTGNTSQVWASPYYVGNLTRDPQTSYMTPRFYADWWEQMFHVVSELDFIAPQDSMGAQGNSFANVTTFLTELAAASARVGRKILSNVELFEVWPEGCQWSRANGMCKGRHPAPFERIKAQMANEVDLVDELIAWEWHTCLSPFGKDNNTTPVYEQYLAYVQGH